MRTMRRGRRGLESVRSGENYKRVGHKMYCIYATYYCTYMYTRLLYTYYKRAIHTYIYIYIYIYIYTPMQTAGNLV